MQKITVKIENAYSDGWESKSEVVVDAPDDLGWMGGLEDWFQDAVYPHTGDGHGADNDLGSVYVATIIAADEPGLVGVKYEWSD